MGHVSAAAAGPRVLVVSGMDFEARIAAGPCHDTLFGLRGSALARALDARLASGPARAAGGIQGVISFGVAGGLDPALPPGTILVADGVQDGGTHHGADTDWARALRELLPQAVAGTLAGVDEAVPSVAAKAVLHHATGALAVDMESHIAARAAGAAGVPFAACRVIVDPATREVPPLAVAGMGADGRTDIAAVLLGLLKAPHQLGALLVLGRDAAAARAALRTARRVVGDGFGLPARAYA